MTPAHPGTIEGILDRLALALRDGLLMLAGFLAAAAVALGAGLALGG